MVVAITSFVEREEGTQERGIREAKNGASHAETRRKPWFLPFREEGGLLKEKKKEKGKTKNTLLSGGECLPNPIFQKTTRFCGLQPFFASIAPPKPPMMTEKAFR